MKDELLKLINEFKKNKDIFKFGEEATKQGIVLRILKELGWDFFNISEVQPEYSVGNQKVDYALGYNGKIKVFIEVKKVNEDLEKHQEQLLNYAFKEGVKLAILTNGISWWFYLPLREGSWEQRKFYTIEILDQKSGDIVEKFEEFLSKDNVISDKAVENAEKLYNSRQKITLITETLPKAWDKIISEPDKRLVEILAETTERLCGHKPDDRIVEEFLGKISQEKSIPKIPKTMPTYSETQNVEDFTEKSIIGFTLRKKEYQVNSWRNLLMSIIEIVLTTNRKQFEKVLSLKGRKRPYFSKMPSELREPEKIKDTDIYVETNLNANSIVSLSKKVIKLFGYDENELIIHTKES